MNKDVSVTVLVSYRPAHKEPASGATSSFLDRVPPPLHEFARRALSAARSAASAELVVGRVPTLSAMILATRSDAGTTFCGLSILRSIVSSMKRCEVAWKAVVQDADQPDALAISAAFPLLSYVFRCVWHTVSSAAPGGRPGAQKKAPGEPTSEAADAAHTPSAEDDLRKDLHDLPAVTRSTFAGHS